MYGSFLITPCKYSCIIRVLFISDWRTAAIGCLTPGRGGGTAESDVVEAQWNSRGNSGQNVGPPDAISTI